jgi:hypothetical protein
MVKKRDKRKSIKFSIVAQQRLREMTTNPRRLSAKIGHAYDHVRKVCNGEVFPGPKLLGDICKALRLDPEEMNKLISQDRVVDKGWTADKLTNRDVIMHKIDRYWEYLSAPDKEEVFAIIRVKAERQMETMNDSGSKRKNAAL